MPNISIMTPEVEDSVIRPSVYSIINQLKTITNIPEDTKILFLDYLRAGYQQGSTLEQQKTDPLNTTKFGFNNQLQIEVDVNYDEGNVNSTAIRRPEHIPLFDDNRIGVFIKPIYFKCNIAINIKFRSKSPTDGKRWRDGIRLHVSNMRDINLHDIEYHYPIPGEVINILAEIHKLRENVEGYGETFTDWLAACSTTRMTTITNQSGTQKQLAVAEKQMKVLGMFDFTIAPEKGEVDGEGHAWITSFVYNVSFDVPVATNMRYPLMIHNQMLDEPFVSTNTAYDIDKVNKAYPMSLNALSYFESTYELDKIRKRTEIIRIPEHDDFLQTSQPHGMQPIFVALCNVDPDNKTDLLNLSELGDFSIDSSIMEFIKEEYPYMTLPYKSILHLSLYRWTALASDKDIYVDQNLNVKSRKDLSLRVVHRVMMFILKDIEMLDRDALLRLRKHKAAANKLLKSININRGMLNLIAHKVNLNSIIENVPESGINLQQLQKAYYQFNTVNTSMILAHKRLSVEELHRMR